MLTPHTVVSKPVSNEPVLSESELVRRDTVYRFLLSECLGLTPEHGAHLLEVRGLSDTTIARRLYSSVPDYSRRPGICRALAQSFDLEGVPGFYRGASGWDMNADYPGILIPVCDARGRIRACQIRRDFEKPRYIWMSSKDMPGGASSRAPVHYAKPYVVEKTGRALITEGALKADICAEHLDCCVVGVAGVDNFPRDFGSILRLELPNLREIAIAYDADWRDNPNVAKALNKLGKLLSNAGLRVKVLDWEQGDGKGLDDYLLGRSNA